MRHFKLIVLVTFAILAGSASASDITTLTKSLKPWQPVEITKSKDAVTV